MKTLIYISIIIYLLVQIHKINTLQLKPTIYGDFYPNYLYYEYYGQYNLNTGLIPLLESVTPTPVYALVCDYTVVQLVYILFPPFSENDLQFTNNPQCTVYQLIQDKSVCESSSTAVPDSWCQTYCQFDNAGSCTSVVSSMSQICECSNVSRSVKVPQKCASLNAAVPNSWCSSYCHFSSSNLCTVDSHMSSVCACSNP